MKLQNLLNSTLLLLIIAVFSGCDDDDAGTAPDLTTEITGNYFGFYAEGIAGWGFNINGVFADITKISSDEVNVRITPGNESDLGVINFEATMTSDSTFVETETFELGGQDVTAEATLRDNAITIRIVGDEPSGLNLGVNYSGIK